MDIRNETTADLGAVLAGGRSSRFGSEKARATVDGEALILRVARALAPRCARVVAIAAHEGAYADLGLATFGDLRPGMGPLGGVATALARAAPGGWVLVASCDLLEIPDAALGALLEGRRPCAGAVAFREGRRWEPFPAVYAADRAAEALARLDAGEASLQRFLDACDAVGLPMPAAMPVQANTREAFERWLAERGRAR